MAAPNTLQLNLKPNTRIMRFLLVGAFAMVLDVGFFWFFLELGLPRVFAAATSFLGASAVNYFLARRWVFGHGKWNPVASIAFFSVGILAGVLLNVAVIELYVFLTGQSAILGKFVAGIVVTIWNYLTRFYVVFRSHG